MIGRTVSHYRILSPLGSGGMGVVYLAEDERLGRQVALKFLPATWSQERMALERFRVEARAASSLTHPGICAIYDIGEDGNTPFIVMEALKGETLRERISKGAMKVTDVVDIGIQLADALDAAHAQGIVHRDIKPANIFVSDKSRVKVLDFGLAKLTSTPSTLSSGADTTSPAMRRAPENQITIPGTALGTVSYMSPEQARGEDIDSRTDLFSLGAVLYEMVTGYQAFGGSTTAVVYDAILNRAPRPIAHLNPLVPPRFEAVIATALEKDRELRYQHASDLQAELKRVRRDLDSASFATSTGGPTTVRSGTAAPVEAPPVPVVTPGRRSWELAAAAIAVLAVLLAGIWIWRGRSPEVASTAAPAAPSTTPAATPTPPAPAPAPQATATPEPVVPAPERTAPPIETPRPTRLPQQQPPAPRVVELPRREPERQAPPPSSVTQPSQSQTPPAVTGPATAAPAIPIPAVTPPATGASNTVEPPPAQPTPAPTGTTSPPASVATAPPQARPAAPDPAPAQAPAGPAAAAETDEAAIRRVLRTYEQAIETEDLALYRSIRPSLTAAEEAVLRNSFRQVNSQVDIRVESLRVDGRTASARIARQDILTNGGRRETRNTTQTMRFEKTASGWVISE